MTPAGPSSLSFLRTALTLVPISRSHASQSMTWPVTLGPSSSSTMATQYGLIEAFSSRPSCTSVNEYILPSPLNFTGSIFPTLFLWHTGHMALGGKKFLPQLLHLMPTMLYLLGFCLQNLGAVAISDPPEHMHDRGRACVQEGDRKSTRLNSSHGY